MNLWVLKLIAAMAIIMTTHDTMLMDAADYIFHIEDGEIIDE